MTRPLGLIAVPTARRPAELRRAVASYSAHLAAHGRSVPLAVFHSARSSQEQDQTKRALEGAAAPGQPAPLYVGLPEKLALAKALRRRAGTPPELLEFALFNPLRLPPGPGGNRNAILLWGAGRRLLSADDDTTAALSTHPGAGEDTGAAPALVTGDPAGYFVPPAGDLSPFALDRAREPAGGLAAALEQAWEACAHAGRPAPLVLLGLAGDCGWGAPFGFFGVPLGFLLLPDDSLDRLTGTQPDWERVLESRTLLRAVPRLTQSRGGPGMTTAFGLDASFPDLPPFLPVGRGEDLLFCALVERLSGAATAHLPLAIAHRPAEPRRFHRGELHRTARSLDLCRTLFSFLETLPPGADLPVLGKHLRAQCEGGDPGFVEALRGARWKLAEREVREARERARGLSHLPRFWQEDLEGFCRATEEAAAEPGTPFILDAGAADPAASITAARALVDRYGALCEVWQPLWAAAREHGAGAELHAPARKITVTVMGSAPDADDALCSPYQSWMWRQHRLDPGSGQLFRALEGEGPLDEEALLAALRALVDRHEALRCLLRPGPADEPLLELRPAGEQTLLRAGPLGDADRAAARRTEQRRIIDLASELPLRLTVARCAGQLARFELWLSVHHCAFDGASEELFWRELGRLYQDLAGGPALAGLAPLRSGFRALARAQRGAIRAHETEDTRHWRAQLAGLPGELRLSSQQPAPERGPLSLRRRRTLPAALAALVREAAARLRASPAALCRAAFAALLHRWSGEIDLLLGVPFANRWSEAEEEQIGLFMTPLPLRLDLSGDPTLLELLARDRARFGAAVDHARLPIDRVARCSPQAPGARRHSLAQVFFTQVERAEAPRLGGLSLRRLEEAEAPPDGDLSLTLETCGDELSAVLLGRAQLFDDEALGRLHDALQAALEQLCRDPSLPLSRLEWLSPADRERLQRWNDTAAPFERERPLTALLREQALRNPEALVLEAGETRLTYRELWRRAERVAARLRAAGVSRDLPVGLYLDRHPALLEALLGILLAGGGYLPLDPALPTARITFLLEDAQPPVLLTRAGLVGELPPHAAQVVLLEEQGGPTSAPPAEPPKGWLGPAPESLAYLLYTSGSTGNPKGALVSHRSLVNFLTSMRKQPGLGPADVLLALTTVSFDIAGLELWLPQLVGARLFLAGREEAGSGELLREALLRSGATVLQATPTTWRALLAATGPGDRTLGGLKALVGGEALPPDLASQLSERCAEAWNLYGPTETTIWSTAWPIPRGAGPVRIGGPIANTQCHVVDARGRPLPPGLAGELLIGGEGVARGYHRRPELTAEKFLDDPGHPGGRLYRTGDLARWLPGGVLEYLGRNDAQLKLRGHRIEPGETEAALLRIEGVREAAVGLHQPPGREPRLVAYLVPWSSQLPPVSLLRARLAGELPRHLVPDDLLEVAALPLTPNGKLDRKRLGALYRAPPQEALADGAAPAPQSPLEAALTAAFGEVLPAPATVETDFFAAGGESLMALRLLGKLRSSHPRLTGAELLLHATPRRLAAFLQTQAGGPQPGAAAATHLVQLRPGLGAVALAVVHPVGGQLVNYARLAQRLDAGIAVHGFEDRPDRAYPSLRERGAAYVRELLAAPPAPRVSLAGYSLGGLLALEMASQLAAAGRPVGPVFLLDAWIPLPPLRGLEKLSFRLRELVRFSPEDRRLWLRAQLVRLPLLRVGDLRVREGANPMLDRRRMDTLGGQGLQWEPPHFGGEVVLLRALRHVRGYKEPPGPSGWERYCPRLEVVSLDCDHRQIVTEPFVERVAREIEARLKAR